MFLASLRLAVALVCVGASLILGAHWLGFIPDSGPITMRARESLSEAIAVNSAAHIRKQQWRDLQATLTTLVDRNPDLLSVGIRSDLGSLRIDTGHHHEIWSDREAQRGRISTFQVPITLNRRPWGEVELCFRNPHQTAIAHAMHHPLVRLLAFFCIAGVFAYTLFVVRVMRLFNSTQVVPDRVRQALDTLTEGLLVLDEKGRIVLANRSFSETIGIAASDLTQLPASGLSWIRPSEDTPLPWTMAIETSQLQSDKMLRFRQTSGDQRIFSVNAAPLGREGSQRGALATFRDVTHVEEHRAELEKMLSLLRSSRDEIKRKNCELEILATQDSLTGCLNRRAFFERYDRSWTETRAQGDQLACVMIDIDHFKNVNDTYGHSVGDEVLRRVSSVIRELHRDHALVCRYGGEEFCLVLPYFDLNRAIEEAEKTRAAISAIVMDDPAELKLTASIGVSELRFDPSDPQDLINQADICLYVAKRQGRDQVISYNPSLIESGPDETDPTNIPARRVEIPYQAVTALVSALSYRDINTAEHSRRVADLCSRAADGIFDPEQTYVLEIAALLHDIGKIGVPDHILLKPGPLTRDEWELMARHDRIGVEIIASAFDCPELSLIISTHHAYFGGSTRDSHLPVGQDIPLGARMLTIADSYDAMVSDRVYRKGRSHGEAIEEMRRCGGTQFDPNLVEHFAKKVEAGAPRVARGALSLRKQTALQIGHQVERLAHAIDTQDADGLRLLASRLGMIARSCDIEAIAEAAEKIEDLAGKEDVQWLFLLRDTHELLDMCRSTQSTFLRQTLECEVKPMNGQR
jgi:diguanylate cyclase (GGDEF)-like protein/PAS domain S-box-containing protein